MSNLTVSVDDQLIKRARMRAIEQGTSVSAKVREFLQQYVDEADPALRAQRATATDRLMAAIEIATAQARPDAPPAGKAKRHGLREQIYEGDFRARSRAAGTTGRTKAVRNK